MKKDRILSHLLGLYWSDWCDLLQFSMIDIRRSAFDDNGDKLMIKILSNVIKQFPIRSWWLSPASLFWLLFLSTQGKAYNL